MKKYFAVLGVCGGLLAAPLAGATDLSYLFMPAAQPGPDPSMLVMMHGYGANEQDFNDFPVIVPGNMLVVSLRAPLPVAGDSYQWYRNNVSESQAASDVTESGNAVVKTVQALQHQYHISPAHTYLGGFSQGAVMTYAVALTHPQLFHGAAIFSGRLPDGFSPAEVPVEAAKQLHVFVGHGEADQRIPLKTGQQAVKQLTDFTPSVVFKTYPGMGHTISLDEIKDFRQWLFRQETP
ncbi:MULTISPECIES: alpha/beta hydrolase [Tatumella]|uniref:Alpha/beta hydrolase n=1 Tax=Tatumella punctata TaxID=399969 RepID=A0ABW1VMU4_9GAMM|nr:dienelactone hydrolase family protein [Tatumella sp. JGM130]